MGAYGGSEQADQLGRMARGGGTFGSPNPPDALMQVSALFDSTIRGLVQYEYEEGAGPPWYEQVTRLGVQYCKRYGNTSCWLVPG